MELNQMRYFRAIAQYGSFSEAAEQLHLTQPAVSKSIAKMEEELGAPLFDRRGIRIELTSAGRMFLGYCGTVLDTVESGITAFQEVSGLKKGHLTIAISTEIFIKHLIVRFLSAHPEVSLTCHLMTIEEMAHALADGSVDFVLSEQPVVGENIDWHPIHTGYLTAILNEHDPLLTRSSIRMEDLQDRYFCIGHLRSNLSSSIFSLCAEAGFQPKVRYLGYDPEMAGILLELPGSVLISSDTIDHSIRGTDANAGGEKYPSLPILGTEGKSVVGVGVRVGHYQSEAAIAFCDLVVDYFRTLP